MQIKLNPVILAGFDVLFLGKKGFSSLAKAHTILVRPKGDKKLPWVRLDVKKYRKKADKERTLYKLLQKESFSRDIEEKKPKRKKVTKKDVPSSDIKFKLFKEVDKVIRDKDDNMLDIKKLIYEVPKAIQFVKGDNYNLQSVQKYITAMKHEFKKIRKKYGDQDYYFRALHQYKAFDTKKVPSLDGKDAKGFSLNRQPYENNSVIDDQFDEVLPRKYFHSFSNYLRFAIDATTFDFVGFMVEITMKKVSKKKKKKNKK